MTITFPTVFLLSLTVLVKSAVYLVDESSGLGRRFDGIGGLSGGGATSRLLVNYPPKQRDEILDYLFKPNFAASLHILKVEIGGDAQSTDGTESSHMHTSYDFNCSRGYEWWLMKEAKKRNPDILLYALPWAFPGWVGNGTRNPYHNVVVTADYVCKWLLCAKSYNNLTIDYIGIWNERPYDVDYIETLRSFMDKRGFQNVKIVASDSKWSIVDNIKKDTKLASAVDYIGVHYPGTNSPSSAQSLGKQLWSSEDYSTFNDNVGAGCWARILNQNYVNGLMTSTISWNLIASYYEALPYTRNGLMTADTPWSGYYRVESPIWMSAHTTQFTLPGWTYYSHKKGVYKLQDGGSMVSFISPDKKDLTIVIETFSHDHSVCIRPPLPPYTVKEQNITLQLGGSFKTLTEINVWYSKLGFGGKPTTLFKKMGSLKVSDGMVSLSLGVDEVYTLTTLTTAAKGEYPDPPADKAFPLPYKDDFDGYVEHGEPNNFAQQIGTFEVMKTNDVRKQVLTQTMLDGPCSWCKAESANKSLNIIGNYQWREVHVSVEAMIPAVNGTTGVFVAGRVDKGGCVSWEAMGVFLFIFPKEKTYILANDLARTQVLHSGQVPGLSTGWNKIDLLLQKDFVVGTVNEQFLFNITAPVKPANGFVALGTDSFGLANFDNFMVNPVEDGEAIMRGYRRGEVPHGVHTERQRGKILHSSHRQTDRQTDTLYFKPQH